MATFDRHHDDQALANAYAGRPRTQLYENIGHTAPGSWHTLAARRLGRLAKCDLQVVCSVFASLHGGESLGPHFDTWYGAIVQCDGAKTWRIGRELLSEVGQPADEVTTRPGDILLLPKYLPHAVTTPPEPGHSVHVTFAIDRDRDYADHSAQM